MESICAPLSLCLINDGPNKFNNKAVITFFRGLIMASLWASFHEGFVCDSRGSPAVPWEAVTQQPQTNCISRSKKKPHLSEVWYQHCVSLPSPLNTL